MVARGLNAQRFVLPDSSESNLCKRSNKDYVISNSVQTGALNPQVPQANAQDEPAQIGKFKGPCDRVESTSHLTSIMRKLWSFHRLTFLITLPLIISYLVGQFFPSVHMSQKLIGTLCTPMGIICRCALPDLFVPLSAINCNADYYHALCSGQEVGSPPTAAPNALSVDVTHIVPAPANALTLGLSNPVTPISPPATIATHNPALTTETSVVHVPDVMLNQPHVFLTEPDVNPKESGIQVESIFPYSSPRYLLADFGLAEGGAKVISGLTSPTEGLTSLSYAAGLIAVLRGYDKTQMHINPPLVVLEEQLSVSNCWRFGGSRGHIAISLSNTIIWTHYTLHFPDHLDASNRKLEQAPKILIMWALVMKSEVEVENLRFLTTWERYVTVKQLVDSSLFNSSSALLEVARILYNPSNGGEQTFLTQLPVETSTVLVEIVDNWGDTSTCLHRISFHSSN